MTMRIVPFALALVSWALGGTAAFAAPAPAPRDDSRGTLIHRTVDANSGATVRLYQRTSADITLEIDGGGVHFSKRLGIPSSAIAIETKTDRIAFVLSPMTMTVTSGKAVIRVTPVTAEATRRELEALIQSSAAYRAGVA